MTSSSLVMLVQLNYVNDFIGRFMNNVINLKKKKTIEEGEEFMASLKAMFAEIERNEEFTPQGVKIREVLTKWFVKEMGMDIAFLNKLSYVSLKDLAKVHHPAYEKLRDKRKVDEHEE